MYGAWENTRCLGGFNIIHDLLPQKGADTVPDTLVTLRRGQCTLRGFHNHDGMITANIAGPVPSSSAGPGPMLGAIPSARLLTVSASGRQFRQGITERGARGPWTPSWWQPTK